MHLQERPVFGQTVRENAMHQGILGMNTLGNKTYLAQTYEICELQAV